MNLLQHLHRQKAWSEKTFGPGVRSAGVIDHIRKELKEIEAAPDDLEEWIDWRTADPNKAIEHVRDAA